MLMVAVMTENKIWKRTNRKKGIRWFSFFACFSKEIKWM